MTGYKAEDVIGRNGRFLQGPDTDSEPVETMRNYIDRSEPAVFESLNCRKGGVPFRNAHRIGPLYNETGALRFASARNGTARSRSGGGNPEDGLIKATDRIEALARAHHMTANAEERDDPVGLKSLVDRVLPALPQRRYGPDRTGGALAKLPLERVLVIGPPGFVDGRIGYDWRERRLRAVMNFAEPSGLMPPTAPRPEETDPREESASL